MAVNVALAITLGKPELRQISAAFPFCVSSLNRRVKKYLIMFLSVFLKVFFACITLMLTYWSFVSGAWAYLLGVPVVCNLDKNS